jgi:hydrogenase maturation factor
MGLIASGALLSVIEQSSAGKAVARLRDAGVDVEIIGRLDAQAGGEPGVFDAAGDSIQQFAADEIARFFSRAG